MGSAWPVPPTKTQHDRTHPSQTRFRMPIGDWDGLSGIGQSDKRKVWGRALLRGGAAGDGSDLHARIGQVAYARGSSWGFRSHDL